jgi:hypothetical protein
MAHSENQTQRFIVSVAILMQIQPEIKVPRGAATATRRLESQRHVVAPTFLSAGGDAFQRRVRGEKTVHFEF